MQVLLLFIALIPLLKPSLAHNGVSGEMRVEEQIKGHIRVSQLSEGDVIRGINGADRTPAWCKVKAVVPVPHSQNQTTYDGFTKNHMVVDSTVHPYGTKGKVRKGPIFTLATECDAAVNSAGQAFTPISILLCPLVMSWSEYLPLIAAIRQAILLTENFWYSLNAYHANETKAMPDLSDQIRDICNEILQCKRDHHTQCQTFEEVMEKFMRKHLPKGHMKDIRIPNMGGDDVEVVRKEGRNRMLLLSSIGVAMVMIGLILVVGLLIYRKRMVKKKEQKELELNHPLVKPGDVKA
ncbi:hypothetical protein ACROYT_G023747 [Oculina patagonica]